MNSYQFIDQSGTFELRNPERTSYLYFPLANESGVMSAITPTLNGDCKMGQNTFLLEPVSSENLHNNKSSRNFWLRIKNKGVWSATGVSAKQMSQIFSEEKEDTKVTAGLMWHQIERSQKKLGIASKITNFVPYTSENVELMAVTIKNIGEVPLEATPIAAIPMYARSADNLRDHRNVTSMLHRIATSNHGVIVHPTLTFDERGHQVNQVHYGVFGESKGEGPISYFPIVEDFIGEGGSFEQPRAVVVGDVTSIRKGEELAGFEAMGGLQFADICLGPNEEHTFFLALGFGSEREQLEADASKFLNEKSFYQTLEETKAYWIKKVNISYQSGDREFDAWMHWVNFQPMLRRIYGCSFLPHHDYGKGGRGYRDLWQDCLALLIMNPTGVRQILIDNFGGVRMDGTNATIIGSKQGEFIADRNNITRVWMDHGVWPFLTTRLYLMQSGDMDFLLEKTYYFKDSQAMRGEEKDGEWNRLQGNKQLSLDKEIYEGSILEHLLIQHITAFYDVGEQGHIRLRGADWNDALDMARERGESVAFTALYASNLRQLAELVLLLEEKKKQGSIELIEELIPLIELSSSIFESINLKQQLLNNYCNSVRHQVSGKTITITCKELSTILYAMADWMTNHIRKTEWLQGSDGYAWYNGYYDNHGQRVEGEFPTGVRMMLTSQVFTIMSGVATNEQVRSIIKSADNYLYEPTIGGYRLNTDFHEVKTDLGRMFGFAYGQKENGSVFSHMAVMYGNALYQRGFYKEGFKVINSLYRHCIDFGKSKIYPGIPEYIDPKGRGMYHYLTGSASWLMLTVLTEMFGIKGDWGDLKIEPHLLKEQFDVEGIASVSTVFHGRCFHIRYCNYLKKEVSEYQITEASVDGINLAVSASSVVISVDMIERMDKNTTHLIQVTLT